MKKIIVAVGSDHAGVDAKERFLQTHEFDHTSIHWIDVGTFGPDRVDYPVFAKLVCEEIASGRAAYGLLICGTGLGMCMAANRVPGMRAALLYSDDAVTYARAHNDANIACFGQRTQEVEDMLRWFNAFLHTSFFGGRHGERIAMIDAANVQTKKGGRR